MSKFNIEKIHDTVWVFRNALENPEEIIQYVNNNKTWTDWYTFGKMAEFSGHNLYFENFPNEDQWNKKFNEIYSTVTEDDYIKRLPAVIENYNISYERYAFYNDRVNKIINQITT